MGTPKRSEFRAALQSSSVHTWGPILLLLYLVAAGTLYSHLEGWSFLDSVYFITVTLSTVGYGDLVPTRDSTKIVTIFFLIFGLSLIATGLGLFMAVASYFDVDGEQQSLSLFRRNKQFRSSPNIHDVDATASGGNKRRRCCRFGEMAYHGQLLVCLVILFVCMFIGAIFYHVHDKLSWLDAFYYAVVSLCAVGYGAMIEPDSTSRVFTVCYLCLGVPMAMFLLGKFAAIIYAWEMDHQLKIVCQRGVDDDMLRELSRNGCGVVTREEFLKYMLVKLRVCSKADLARLDEMFTDLDLDRSGVLDYRDVAAHAAKHSMSPKSPNKHVTYTSSSTDSSSTSTTRHPASSISVDNRLSITISSSTSGGSTNEDEDAEEGDCLLRSTSA